jgi:aspartate 1-decarboxylase
MSLIVLLKSKLHHAVVTQADLEYEGSIAIDQDLLDAARLRVSERVDVLNINNGARFTTYTIAAPRGSRVIGVNGAAARLVQKGDRVIIVAYRHVDEDDPKVHEPTVIILDEQNTVKRHV